MNYADVISTTGITSQKNDKKLTTNMEESYINYDSFMHIIGHLDLAGLRSLSLTTTELYDLTKDILTTEFIERVTNGQILRKSIYSRLRSTPLHSLLPLMTNISEVDVNVDELISGYTEDERVTLFLAFCSFIRRRNVLGFWLNPGQMKRKDLFNLSRFLFTLGYRKEAVDLEFDTVVRCSSSSGIILQCNIEIIMDELMKDLSANKLTHESNPDLIREYRNTVNIIIGIYQHIHRIHDYNHANIDLTCKDRDAITTKLEKISIGCRILSDIIGEL